MAKFYFHRGVFFIEFDYKNYESCEEHKTIKFIKNGEIYSEQYDIQVVNNDPLIVCLSQNPKSLHDMIVSCDINSVWLEIKDKQLITEPLKIESNFHINFDSISFVNNIPYQKPKIISAFTHVYNETEMIKLWVKYYGTIVGNENLYIIDHGSTNNFKELLPSNVNIITIPRGLYDNWNISTYCSYFQRFLLTQYYVVIHTDCDEFLMYEENNNFYKLVAENKTSNLYPENAYDVIMDCANESDLNYDQPILNQRSKMLFNSSYQKPTITTSPVAWYPGFHKCCDKIKAIKNLWLFHLKLIDSKQTIKRSQQIWQTLNQSELDKKFFKLETDLIYQANDVDIIKNTMLSMAENSVNIPEWSKRYL